MHPNDQLSIKHSSIGVLFQKENYLWIQAGCVLRSVLKHHAGGQRQTENKGNRGLQCSLSSSSLNLFVHRAAAHFWSTVVCLCQMPKRMWNEEGHMKRGRVTVAMACNHTHTHRHTNCRMSLLNPAHILPVNHCLQPLVVNPVSFTHHCLFRNMGKVKQRNMVTWMKFNWNCTELGES